MRDLTALTPTAAKMAQIVWWLRMIAIFVPMLFLMAETMDGVTWTDLIVTAIVAGVLWLFAGIAHFTVGALAEMERKRGP
jgi:hypothetical protein